MDPKEPDEQIRVRRAGKSGPPPPERTAERPGAAGKYTWAEARKSRRAEVTARAPASC